METAYLNIQPCFFLFCLKLKKNEYTIFKCTDLDVLAKKKKCLSLLGWDSLNRGLVQMIPQEIV